MKSARRWVRRRPRCSPRRSAFVSRMTGNDDVVLTLPVTGRATARIRNAGGMLANTLPVRAGIPDSTVAGVDIKVQIELVWSVAPPALSLRRHCAGRWPAGFGAGLLRPGCQHDVLRQADRIDGATSEVPDLVLGDARTLCSTCTRRSPVRHWSSISTATLIYSPLTDRRSPPNSLFSWTGFWIWQPLTLLLSVALPSMTRRPRP